MCRGGLLLGALVLPSPPAPPARAFVLWLGRPGKLLLSGPCLLGSASSSCRGPRLLGPASSSCRGLVLNAWSSLGPKRVVETLGAPLASLAAGCYNFPCTSSGY